MPQYQFRCDGCGATSTVNSQKPSPCPRCGLNPHRQRRVWAFTVSPSMPEHFNYSLGKYVSNTSQLNDGFKRASDEASERLGIEHDYQPIHPSDLRDPSAHGVTEEGLDSTRRVLYEKD